MVGVTYKKHTETTIYLTLKSTPTSHVRNICKIWQKQRGQNSIFIFQGIANPVESFQEATVIWIAHALVQDSDGTCWVRLLKLTKDEILTDQNSRVAMLDPLDTDELTLHLKQKEEIATVQGLDIHKHVKPDDKHKTAKQLGYVQLLFQKTAEFDRDIQRTRSLTTKSNTKP